MDGKRLYIDDAEAFQCVKRNCNADELLSRMPYPVDISRIHSMKFIIAKVETFATARDAEPLVHLERTFCS